MNTRQSTSISQISSFDPKAEFKETYDKFAPSVLNYLSLFLKNNDLAEDICQEVFIKAYDQIIKNEGTRPLSKTWLYTVAKNAALDWLKMNTTKKELPRDPDILQGIEDLSASFVRDLEIKEVNNKIKEILDYLHSNEKTVFLLRNNEELKYKDISKIMQISERNAKRLMKSALRKIVFFLKKWSQE
jgi:RNA polymerase sigma-70 factor (ECF subfamily)